VSEEKGRRKQTERKIENSTTTHGDGERGRRHTRNERERKKKQ